MMEDMNIDFDLEDDPIKKFLLHKLKDIRLNNEELEQQINRRKELVDVCVTRMASGFGENILEIAGVWQRILNGKWIIGFRIINTSSIGVAKNINVVLKWDSTTPFTYYMKGFWRFKRSQQHKIMLPDKLKTIVKNMEESDYKKLHPLESEWIETTEVQESTLVLVTFDLPDFVEKSHYKISGIFNYQLTDRNCQLNIPDLEIHAFDVTNSAFVVKDVDVIEGNEEAFLSTLATHEKTQLIVQVPKDTYTGLDNILEFECRFRRINVVSSRSPFFVNAVADAINGAVLEVDKENDNIYNLNIFSRNKATLETLLQYLHHNIRNILILPKRYKPNLMEEPIQNDMFLSQKQPVHEVLQSKLRAFGKALEELINFLEKFCMKRLGEISEKTSVSTDEIDLNVQDYQDFRKQLADLELNSDLLCFVIQQLIGKSEPLYESNED